MAGEARSWLLSFERSMRDQGNPLSLDVRADPEIASLLSATVRACQQAWPDLFLSADDVVTAVGRVLPSGERELVGQRLAELYAADVVLTHACLRGDPRALSLWQKTYGSAMRRAVRRILDDEMLVDDVMQTLATRLFVNQQTAPARAASYLGTGPLLAWLRVTATREALRVKQSRSKEVAIDDGDDDIGASVSLLGESPELAHLKERARVHFATSLAAAFQSLEARQQNLLRYSLLEQLSIDEIGAIYGVHRASAARWLNDAREQLAARTREELRGRLSIPTAEAQSWMRLIRSQLDMRLSALFSAEDSPPVTPH